jgi:hypothetical protein
LQSRTYLNTSETGPVLALATVSGATLTGNVTQPTTFAVIGRTNAYGTPGLYRFNNNLTSPTFISPLPFGSSSSHFFRIIPGNTALMVIDITSPQAYGYTYNYSVGGPGGGAIGPNGVLQPGFDFTPGRLFVATRLAVHGGRRLHGRLFRLWASGFRKLVYLGPGESEPL